MKLPAKPSSIIIPAFTLEAGQKPERDRSLRGALGLRDWQRAGLVALRDALYRILLAPTGSGKSTLIKALSALDLTANPRRLAVIAVPQSIIAGSFGAVSIVVDGKPVAWEADHLIDTTKSIAKLEALLLARKPHLGGRFVVCTHRALVLAHQRVMKTYKGKKSPWQDVALYIDEAHHSRAAGEDDDGDAVESNQLGAVVAHYLAAKPGPLLLTTATWMRAQFDDIIPKGHEDTFTRFTHTLEADLRSKQHLKSVAFRFLIGKPEDAIRELYGEGNKKTIAYLPHVGSATAKGAGGKAELLRAYQAAIGEEIGGDAWTSMLSHKPRKGRAFGVRSLDFVTVDGRDERKAALADGIARGGRAITPDILWALNLGKEGFDWPELERAIVVGARGSIPEVLQMMGRVMRDHPGKANAEFNVVLPHSGGDMDPAQVHDYMKMILASMVIEWPFRAPVKVKRKGKLAAALDDPREAVRAIEAVVDRALQGGGAEKDGDVIRGALKGLHPKASKAEIEEAKDGIEQMFTARSLAMMASASDMSFDVDVTDGSLGCVRALAMRIGHTTLAELRESLNTLNIVTATVDDVRAFCAGLTQTVYDKTKPVGFPWANVFHRHYGLTYGQISGRTMVTVRHKFSQDGFVTEEVLRAAIVNLTPAKYEERRQAGEFGAGFPSLTYFKKVYGKTFVQIRSDSDFQYRKSTTASRADVAAQCKGKTAIEYNAQRPAGYPTAYMFKKLYGVTYPNIAETRPTLSATIDEVRVYCQGMTCREYDRKRVPGMPSSVHFKKYFNGLTFPQVRDGVTLRDNATGKAS